MTAARQRRPVMRDALPYRVTIRAGSKCGEWGKFPTVEAASAVATKLRAHGLDAIVEEPRR